MATSTIKNVDQYNVVAKVQVACASDSPTTSEIKAGIVKLYRYFSSESRNNICDWNMHVHKR